MKKQMLQGLLILFMAGLLFYGCNDDNNDDVTPGQKPDVEVKFYFSHRVDNVSLIFDNIGYVNAAGNSYSVATLKYFVSDFRLVNTDGDEVTINEEHYVDGKDNGTLLFAPDKKISAGEYTEMKFIFGLSEEKNVDGRFPDAPENNMEWPEPLGEGYHYMKLEGKLDSAGTTKNYQAHTGPTNNNHFFIEVSLPINLVVEKNDQKIIYVGMNINNWWNNPHTLDLNNMTMVMGNEDMQQKLMENGQDVFFIESIE